MSKLCFKFKDQEDVRFYYCIPEDGFIISERNTFVEYCEEYDIIKKIQENKDGFFDFSKNMIDIGAEDGNYAMLLDFKHSYCFEPNKKASCLLYANMYLKNKTNNTTVYNVALSEIEGTIEFDGFCCEDSDCTYETPERSDPYEVETKPLDFFNFKNVGFIKIDVEGYEERVIRGGLLTIISNKYPPILFECWDVDSFGMTKEKRDSLFNLLKTLDYEIFEYWGDHQTHLAVHKTQINK